MQTTVQCTDSGHVPTKPVRRSLCCGTGLYCRTRTRSTSPRQLPPCTATIACMHACMQISINILISLTFQQEKSSAICTAHFAHPFRMSVCLTVVFCAHAVRPSHPAAHSDQPQTSACSPDRQTRKRRRWMSPAGPSAALVLLKNRVHRSEHFSN